MNCCLLYSTTDVSLYISWLFSLSCLEKKLAFIHYYRTCYLSSALYFPFFWNIRQCHGLTWEFEFCVCVCVCRVFLSSDTFTCIIMIYFDLFGSICLILSKEGQKKKQQLIFDPNWLGFRIPNFWPKSLAFSVDSKQWAAISLKHRQMNLWTLLCLYDLSVDKKQKIYETHRSDDGGWWRMQPCILAFQTQLSNSFKIQFPQTNRNASIRDFIASYAFAYFVVFSLSLAYSKRESNSQQSAQMK